MLYLFSDNYNYYYITNEENCKKFKNRILKNSLQDGNTFNYIGKISYIYYTCDIDVAIKDNRIKLSNPNYSANVTIGKKRFYLINNSMSKFNIDDVEVYSYRENSLGCTYKKICVVGGKYDDDIKYHISIPIKYMPTEENLLTTCSSSNKELYMSEIKEKALSLLKVEYEKYKQQKINDLNTISDIIDKGLIENEKNIRNYYALNVSEIRDLAEKIYRYN